MTSPTIVNCTSIVLVVLVDSEERVWRSTLLNTTMCVYFAILSSIIRPRSTKCR
ncbi:hypothetical protein OESDEN_17807 [Oesophagostomum dentatum]|uniref:Uncharacterized protein n=1 Tax=Oesophagostomum dentatum TaxID=61180 RepID=A0A0B1SC54_OESDE|nr:hypothetical protein OESDEN_17807 [Oesophagostomum dentatum]